MIYHVLPGDAQVEEFNKTGLDGKLIVFREALISGPIDAPGLAEFWDERAQFVLAEYGDDVIDYHEKVADEINVLTELTPGSELNLWFEYELFCSVNMWFCLDLLNGSDLTIFRVAPLNASPDEVWKGFGRHDAADLLKCFESRIEFTVDDIEQGSRLWNAFRHHDHAELRRLADHRSPCFPFLKEVCEAAAVIETRPIEILSELRNEGISTFEAAFPEFQKRAAVYGFGDVQVESMWQRPEL